MRLLNANDVASTMPMSQWMDAMEAAFLDLSQGRGESMARQSLNLPSGVGLFMGAASPELGLMGKLVASMPANTLRGLPGTPGSVLLHDPDTGRPEALIDGTLFTAWRTAALTGFATRLLATKQPSRALLFGCGAQAQTQLLALDAAFELEAIGVCGRSDAQARDFIRHHGQGLRNPIVAISEAGRDRSIDEADVIVTATNSDSPLFGAEQVSAGCHISAIGSFRPGMCEIDPSLMARARVYVEHVDSAATDAGELIEAARLGLCPADDWVMVGEVLSGAQSGRCSANEITVFKSVGHAVFDLHAARALVRVAREQGLGTLWESGP